MKGKKGVAILGSTGSIGTQALEVIDTNPNDFDLQVITANKNADLLINQAIKFRPNNVVIVDESLYNKVQDALFQYDIHVYTGEESLLDVVCGEDIDIVLTAMVGCAGLKPTLSAIKAKKNIALANKETLVVAGEIITKEARNNGVNIYPVDSEHSAIFQCIVGEFHNKIEKIYLTASGGPFRGFNKDDLSRVTTEQALKHPNWEMGQKITIDSATLMNKGLEVIEAKWLFNLRPEQIEVIVHPQSIIHSIVQFEDGSMKAQLGLPDMKLPIQYALTYPNRIKSNFERFNFIDYPKLTFERPDEKTFNNLKLAFDVLKTGGTSACTLNAANEVAVDAFLKKRISFLDISKINSQTLEKVEIIKNPSLEDYIMIDKESRKVAEELI
ncbi:MAG: 1-deoxy-D-xylulose-5-phosphate reductoisomerase [Crocinitomicaceae bacterium]|nr:1-deoxy-D-xylulose-5-phosphate reductoisomerase [Crocinitomicaceae bacterium]|tara:strand:- start:13962 stop:15116 length:1155 start_codon:yes stop_codon:yes gene_type:complete